MNINLIKNVFHLALGQSVNYITPLVLTPYIIYYFGLEGLGVISFSIAVVTFLRVVLNWGFDTVGTKDISAATTLDKEVEVFSNIISAKIFILAIVILISLALFPALSDVKSFNQDVFASTLIILISDLLVPVWYYLGKEQAKQYSRIRISQKLLNVILFFIVIDASSEIYLVPLIESISSLIIAIIVYFELSKRVKFKLIFDYRIILNTLNSSFNVFISSVSVLFYTTLNSIVLGVFSTSEAVGIYALAEKVYSAIRGMFNPIIQASYPTLVKIQDDRSKFNSVVKNYLIMMSVILFFISVSMITVADYVIQFLANDLNAAYKNTFYVLMASLIFATGGLTSLLLVIKGRSDLLRKLTFISTMINLVLIIPACVLFDALGCAVVFFIVQAVQFLMQLRSYKDLK